jgi:ferredoxin
MCILDQRVKSYAPAMGLEVEIDRDVCMGSGNCVYEAPGAFDLDDDSISSVVDPAESSEDKIITAAQKCPTHAITVRRDGVRLV